MLMLTFRVAVELALCDAELDEQTSKNQGELASCWTACDSAGPEADRPIR